MKIRFISYGFKYYEGEDLAAPKHDFLFSLRDLPNPYWDENLREFNGLDKPVIEFFQDNERATKRLEQVKVLVKDFIDDFLANPSRTEADSLTFAFRCTGGKHRSVYFAKSVYDYTGELFAGNDKIDLEIEHVDLPRYLPVGG